MLSYNVLRPRYYPTGEFFRGTTRAGFNQPIEYQRLEWQVIGQAVDIADAKRKFGGAPVLEVPRG